MNSLELGTSVLVRVRAKTSGRIFGQSRVRAKTSGRIFEPSRVRAKEFSSASEFGQCSSMFRAKFEQVQWQISGKFEHVSVLISGRFEQYFKHKLLQSQNEKMEMAFVWALSRFLAEKIHNHKFKCWLTQILAIFSSNLAFFKSVMIFWDQCTYKLIKIPQNRLDIENLESLKSNFVVDLLIKFSWVFIQQLKCHLHPVTLFLE